MRTNKKMLFYFFIALLLVSSSLTYVALAKNTWKAKNTNGGNVSKEKVANSAVPSAATAATVIPAATNTDDATIATQDVATTASVSGTEYLLHKNISTTYFWAGEEADADNKNISNLPSAWDEDWVKHFGGIDNPKKRNGFYPAGFTPKENPFYFALPYNDFDSKGNQKNYSVALTMWDPNEKIGAEQSMCKNQWIKITKDGKTVYAQWEDVGPFGEDDKAYVFGGATPKSKENSHAGLDVSPAVHDYLGLSDVDKTDWQFVDASAVPDGPWKKIVTTSQVFWK